MAVASYIFTDGGSKFSHYYTYINGLQILAANASLWAPHEFENPSGKGYLLQIDHLNKKTGSKFSRVMQCERMPQDNIDEQDEKCIHIETRASFIHLIQ